MDDQRRQTKTQAHTHTICCKASAKIYHSGGEFFSGGKTKGCKNSAKEKLKPFG